MPSKRATLVLLGLLILIPQSVLAGPSDNAHFNRVWDRTDQPVAEAIVARTWIWGPEPISPVMEEPYAESPDGMREVQYFDKARMEITHPDAGDPDSIWYVTNGLLVVELILGNVQVGDTTFMYVGPANIPVAGDPDDPAAPTYSTFSPMYESNLLDAPPRAIGDVIIDRVGRHGHVIDDRELGALDVRVAYTDGVSQHSIAGPFWEFMNSSGPVIEDGEIRDAPLFENPFFATGRPITEAYWATVKVGGTPRDVLLQCFERRCLTYTPGNPDGFVVEAGNVGLHYFNWRYEVAESAELQPGGGPAEAYTR